MIIYGHRGARGEAPENTLAGFRHAMDHGVRYFELDLRRAAGDEIVVLHDATLHRTHHARGAVSRRASHELADLAHRDGFHEWEHSTGVTTLDTVVQQCRKVKHFQFEVKTGQLGPAAAFCDRLADYIVRMRLATRVTVTSLDRDFLATLAERHPGLSRGLVTETVRPDPVRAALALDCGTLVLHHSRVDARFRERTLAAGLQLSTWTVNDLPEVTRLYRLGVDSLITDYPTAMLAHVRMLGSLKVRPARTI